MDGYYKCNECSKGECLLKVKQKEPEDCPYGNHTFAKWVSISPFDF
ncbi:hypothetical protein KAH94_05855 [bacterium]|nr:hypothetical protein [bacterium]